MRDFVVLQYENLHWVMYILMHCTTLYYTTLYCMCTVKLLLNFLNVLQACTENCAHLVVFTYLLFCSNGR